LGKGSHPGQRKVGMDKNKKIVEGSKDWLMGKILGVIQMNIKLTENLYYRFPGGLNV